MNELDAGLESVLSNFADDTNLGGAFDCVEGREVWQKGLDKFQSWLVITFMNFSKCRLLHLGRSNLGYTHR